MIFGDSEPEDAWHPDDPVDELLDNLDARCTLLGERRRLRDDAAPADRLAELQDRIDRALRRRHRFDAHDLNRLELLTADLVYVWARL